MILSQAHCWRSIEIMMRMTTIPLFQEYYEAFEAGYQLFLTENYHVQPFRLFMELDFDWEIPGRKLVVQAST